MKQQSVCRPVLGSIVLCLAIGGIASWLTIDGIQGFASVQKPPLSPPMWLFPVVWSILLTCMGIGLGRVLAKGRGIEKERAITAFAIQITFFFCWMIWFFGLHWYGFSAIWLAGMLYTIWRMIRAYRVIDAPAAWLQFPYLLWSTFALYLTVGVWWCNR